MKKWIRSLPILSCLPLSMASPFSLAVHEETQVSVGSQAEHKTMVQQVRQLKQSNLVYMQLDTGLVVLELTPNMAPNYVKQFTGLVNEGYYNGLDFYRVIDGFVAQAGDMNQTKKSASLNPIKAELTRAVTSHSDFYSVQKPAFWADETGFINGFPAGRDNTDKVEWLLHCPGTVALARGNTADSGIADFYIVIGHAPRSLDRNLTVFARVVQGMDKVQKVNRAMAEAAGGVIKEPRNRTRIISAVMGSRLAKEKQLVIEQQTVMSDAFQARLNTAKTLPHDFYIHKGSGKVDVCYYQPKYQVKTGSDS